jgi:hypothetical protein
MDRSDAALAKITSLVRSWDTEDAWETKGDWGKLREIRSRVEERGKRDWASHPPWEENQPSRAIDENVYSQAGQQRAYMSGDRATLPTWQEEPYSTYRG